MSMFDSTNKSIKNSPFSDLSNRAETPANPFEGLTLRKEDAAYRLSTRASFLTAFLTIALCLQVPSYSAEPKAFWMSVLLALGIAAAYVVFWSVSFRFFENPDMMPLSVVLNIIPAALGYIFFPKISLISAVLIAAGLTALTIDTRDDSKSSAKPSRRDSKGFRDVDFLNGELIKYSEFVPADPVHEILIPFACAVVSAMTGILVSHLICTGTGASGKGLVILISSLILVLISFVISKIRGKDFLLSSSKLSDASNLPAVEFRALRSFFLRRTRFFLSIILIGAGCLLCDYINGHFELGFPFMKYILGALLLFAFAFMRGRNSEHCVQFVVELLVIYAVTVIRCHSVLDLVILAFFMTIADILISGMMLTHNRRLIMSGRSKYAEGMPLELMSVALIIMASEVMLSYWDQILI